MAIYCALVHHPVQDRQGQEITTSVTNIDVHDIARSAKTFGLAGYFIVHPISAQRPVVERIVDHWCAGEGRARIPERAEALGLVRVVPSIAQALESIADETGRAPRVWATSARHPSDVAVLGFAEAQAQLRSHDDPTLILFGSGHGLARRVVESADAVLEPITGIEGYNHLSVRAAAAIILGRVSGAI